MNSGPCACKKLACTSKLFTQTLCWFNNCSCPQISFSSSPPHFSLFFLQKLHLLPLIIPSFIPYPPLCFSLLHLVLLTPLSLISSSTSLSTCIIHTFNSSFNFPLISASFHLPLSSTLHSYLPFCSSFGKDSIHHVFASSPELSNIYAFSRISFFLYVPVNLGYSQSHQLSEPGNAD